MRLIFSKKQQWKCIFQGVIFRIHLLREQCFKKNSWGSNFKWKNFENIFFERVIFWRILKMYFLRKQFWGRNFWKYFESREQMWAEAHSREILCSPRKDWCPDWLFLGKGGDLKDWILELPVKNKGCSSIQFLLREFY